MRQLDGPRRMSDPAGLLAIRDLSVSLRRSLPIYEYRSPVLAPESVLGSKHPDSLIPQCEGRNEF
jgi:hypothetical protein